LNPVTRLLIKSQRIDRRVLYVLLAVVLSTPFLFDVPVPPTVVSPQTRNFFDTVEAIAKDPVESKKLVILSVNYDAGTLAENHTQAEAVMRHLMKLHLKFALFDFAYPQGRELAQGIADRIGPKYGYLYGRDYVNWGYRPSAAIVPILKAAVADVPGAIGNDIKGSALANVPVMAGIKTVDDIGLIVEVTPSETLPTWLQYFQRAGKAPIPTLYCPTRVMAPQAFPFLKSGQLQGMLSGLNGTIEYEGLIHEPGFATRASASLSYSHLLIMALIVLGNVGMFAARRAERGRE
jgi:hypothetical protein